MYEIVKEEDQIVVSVSLEKRIFARQPKIYVYMGDALRAAVEKFPELKLSSQADNTRVASTVRPPHQVTWKFKILGQQEQLPESQETTLEESESEKKLPKKTKQAKTINKKTKKLSKKQEREALDELVELSQEMGGYDKELATDLTSDKERAIVEETTEKVQEPTE